MLKLGLNKSIDQLAMVNSVHWHGHAKRTTNWGKRHRRKNAGWYKQRISCCSSK